MPALNYKKEVIHKLKPGPGQTIRPAGKPMRMKQFRLGAKLYHFTGMMTKNCRKLGESTISEVVPMTMVCRSSPVLPYEKRILLYGKFARAISYDGFAQADGFNDFREMEQFFINTYKLKPGDSKDFTIIKWRDFVPVKE